jgi:hypothetical protein
MQPKKLDMGFYSDQDLETIRATENASTTPLLADADWADPRLGLNLREMYRLASVPPGQPGALPPGVVIRIGRRVRFSAAAHGVAGRDEWKRHSEPVSIVRRGRIEGTPEGWAAAAPRDIYAGKVLVGSFWRGRKDITRWLPIGLQNR